MPYESAEDLPEPVKKLPLRARVIWMDAFDRAYYGMLLPEDRCFAYSWGSVKKAYEKNPVIGKWVLKKGVSKTFKVFKT